MRPTRKLHVPLGHGHGHGHGVGECLVEPNLPLVRGRIGVGVVPCLVDPDLLCDQQVSSMCLLVSGRRDGHHAVISSRDIFALLTDPDTGTASLLDLSHYCPALAQDNWHLTKKKTGKVSALPMN